MTNRWREIASDDAVADYDRVVAERVAEVERAGGTAHAEAELVAELCPAGGSVLDAGCGTGRVAWRLAELGFTVVGVDSDPRMLRRASAARPGTDHTATARAPEFVEADLATYHAGVMDVVLAAGNVVPLLPPQSLTDAIHTLAGQLRAGGHLVHGFGLTPATLPRGCPPTPLDAVGAACAAAGLVRVNRWGTWERGPFTGDYVVEVHTPCTAG